MEIIKKIEQVMQENHIYGEVGLFAPDLPFNVYEITISWGDWKHDHWRLDHLIEKIGGTHTGTVVTEEDGSDCYSAVHYYVFTEEE